MRRTEEPPHGHRTFWSSPPRTRGCGSLLALGLPPQGPLGAVIPAAFIRAHLMTDGYVRYHTATGAPAASSAPARHPPLPRRRAGLAGSLHPLAEGRHAVPRGRRTAPWRTPLARVDTAWPQDPIKGGAGTHYKRPRTAVIHPLRDWCQREPPRIHSPCCWLRLQEHGFLFTPPDFNVDLTDHSPSAGQVPPTTPGRLRLLALGTLGPLVPNPQLPRSAAHGPPHSTHPRRTPSPKPLLPPLPEIA